MHDKTRMGRVFAFPGATRRDATFPLQLVWENNRLFCSYHLAATPRKADNASCSAICPSTKKKKKKRNINVCRGFMRNPRKMQPGARANRRQTPKAVVSRRLIKRMCEQTPRKFSVNVDCPFKKLFRYFFYRVTIYILKHQ